MKKNTIRTALDKRLWGWVQCSRERSGMGFNFCPRGATFNSKSNKVTKKEPFKTNAAGFYRQNTLLSSDNSPKHLRNKPTSKKHEEQR